jgi:Na+-driven multidrug efflux pump
MSKTRTMATQKGNSSQLARYASLSTQWAVMLLVAVWLGHKADEWTHWRIPVFVIVLPLGALLVSLFQLIREVSSKK